MTDAPYSYRPEYDYRPGDRVGVQMPDGTVYVEQGEPRGPVRAALDRIGDIKATLGEVLGDE